MNHIWQWLDRSLVECGASQNVFVWERVYVRFAVQLYFRFLNVVPDNGRNGQLFPV